MSDRRPEQSREQLTREMITAPPAVESFFGAHSLDTVWPAEIAHNPEFQEQIATRKELHERLNEVQAALPRPDMSLETAITEGHLSESQATNLYTSLSDLFETSHDYDRLALYLPFECLPMPPDETTPENRAAAANRLREAYMNTWDRLLYSHDVRANFVDGDVMEVPLRKGDLPRVVKAAHLIPKLVEKSMLHMNEVFHMLENSNEETFQKSIADTLPVLADLGFITDQDLPRLQSSPYEFVRQMADRITSPTPETADLPSEDFLTLQTQLETTCAAIDAEAFGPDVTKKRAQWLREEGKKAAIAATSQRVRSAIESGSNPKEVLDMFTATDTSTEMKQALVEGIRSSVERLANQSTEQAIAAYHTYQTELTQLWSGADAELTKTLSKAFFHLHKREVIPSPELHALGLEPPKLGGPFSEHFPAMQKEMNEIRDIAVSIENDPVLSKFIYPAVIVFGSRLKGYGTENSDIDVAVFVKPGIDEAKQAELRTLLGAAFSHEKIEGAVFEFWLEETGDDLTIKDSKTFDMSRGGKTWTHVLYGGALEGEASAVQELRHKVLAPYLKQTEEQKYGQNIRAAYLEELERDALQYRLMHKGYTEYNPAFGGMNTPNSDTIDGDSAFWDSGYRHTATKLFVDRVFLPTT